MQLPSGAFPLGTDAPGRDVLSRVLHGGAEIILLSVVATVLGCGVGVAVGLLSGYAAGLVDTVLMRIADTFMSVPSIIFALVLFAAAGATPTLLVVAVAVGHAPRMARIVRGVSLDVVTLDFVTAAATRGERLIYILRKELLPNLLPPILVEFSLRLGYSVLSIAALAFLGFGLQPPDADWGGMINENRDALTIQPWSVLVPALLIGLLTAAVALIGDGLTRAVGRHGGQIGEQKGSDR